MRLRRYFSTLVAAALLHPCASFPQTPDDSEVPTGLNRIKLEALRANALCEKQQLLQDFKFGKRSAMQCARELQQLHFTACVLDPDTTTVENFTYDTEMSPLLLWPSPTNEFQSMERLFMDLSQDEQERIRTRFLSGTNLAKLFKRGLKSILEVEEIAVPKDLRDFPDASFHPLLLAKLQRFNVQCGRVDPNLPGKGGTEVPGLRELLMGAPPDPQPASRSAPFLDFVAGISTSRNIVNSVIGSAFYVRDDYFVTASHVVSSRSTLFLFSGRTIPGDIQPANIFEIDKSSIRTDAVRDLTVFRVLPTASRVFAHDVFKEPPCLTTEKLPQFAKLKIAGFPRDAFLLIETPNCVLLEFFEEWSNDNTTMKADILGMGTTFHGYSGAPIMNQADGCVIAVLRAQMTEDHDGTQPLAFPPTKEHAFRGINVKYALNLIPKK